MKAYRLAAAGLALGLLTGCASLLERSYTTSEPHSSKFWESEAAATLRAENRQDMVNDLLILISQHTETASLRLYNFPDEQTALEELEKAAQEVQQETPLGAYAVEYITYISQPQRSCFEADLQIGYRRTAEQMQTIVSASSVSALGDLLEAALDGGRTELVVRMGYWQADSREKVAQEVQQVRQERGDPGGSGLDRPLLSGNRPGGDHRIPTQAHGGRNSGVSSRAGGCGAVGCSDGIGGIFSRTGVVIGSLKDIEKTIEKM